MPTAPRYVTPRPPRHRVVVDGAGEVIVLTARRNWFALPFLSVWLTMWTFGGITAIGEVMREFQWFLCIWLVGWAAGWTFAAATILWQLVGREVIAVRAGDLSLQLRAGPFARTRVYRGGEVRNLRAPAQSFVEKSQAGFAPFINRMGAVQFDHGARTIGFAGGVDEAEAAMLRDWVAARLTK